jgi:AraC-like DNA-binding protein
MTPEQPLEVKQKIEPGKTLKVAVFNKGLGETQPHRHHGYLEIIFLSAGNGSHTIDFGVYPLAAPVMYVIRREQVHHWKITEAPEGFVLIIKKQFVENSHDKTLKSLITRLSAFTCLIPSDPVTLTRIFQLLVQEYDQQPNPNTPVIEGLVKVLLAKALELGKPHLQLLLPSEGLFHRFNEVLLEEKSPVNSVRHYAAQLSTTPQNLNAACTKATGQSASVFLGNFITDEAKRLLLFTDLTVSEISIRLQFKDPSHFVKFFRRFTSITPQAYREQS